MSSSTSKTETKITMPQNVQDVIEKYLNAEGPVKYVFNDTSTYKIDKMKQLRRLHLQNKRTGKTQNEWKLYKLHALETILDCIEKKRPRKHAAPMTAWKILTKQNNGDFDAARKKYQELTMAQRRQLENRYKK